MYTELCHVVIAGQLKVEEGVRIFSAIKQNLWLYNQEVDEKYPSDIINCFSWSYLCRVSCMMSCDIKNPLCIVIVNRADVMKYENLNPQSNVACEGIKEHLKP